MGRLYAFDKSSTRYQSGTIPPMTLTDLYDDPCRAVVTAHRGWSARYPANTIHDATLDRTTDGTGPVADRTLAELERLTAAFWHGPHDTGRRTASPFAPESVPTLAATLGALARVNVFYANTGGRAASLLDLGIRGVLTDCPDTVIATARARGLRA